MRVVVIGASGNLGTALLRLLRDDPVVTSVVAVARRVPPASVGWAPPPYDRAEWHGADLGTVGPDAPVVARLREIVGGADAVVHLAWQVQPSHDRERLRRVHVDGTRRLLRAVAEARVPHLVVASSVGAYSPSPVDRPRDESWETDGIRTSDYSQDKVAVERLLDEATLLHPGLVIARLRPALVLQQAAGQEVVRLFLGPLVPTGLLAGRLPVLPWPRHLRLQVVHADDVAVACREVVVRQAAGPFNVAAPDLLRAPEVAALVSEGRWREVDPAAARTALAVAWHARLARVGPGWLDMARCAPVLDAGRAERELGFRPARSGAEALADLLRGVVRGSGTASPPLRAR
jgi:nucleoside-diphosphate-sugar epimerase